MRRVFTRPILSLLIVVSLFAVSTAAAFADPRDFTLVNGSGITLTHVYVSSSDDSDWGDDILGQDVLDPGQTVDIVFSRFTEGECLYDIRVLARDGREGYLYKVNLCTTTTVTFS